VNAETLTLVLGEGERWWGGAVADGQDMPFGARAHRRDLATNAGTIADPSAGPNQSAPLLISNRGRWVWSDTAFAFSFDGAGGLSNTGTGLLHGEVASPAPADDSSLLRAAFRAASAAHFPPSGRTPAEAMFTGPQYNTWIEMPYRPTQAGVLDYVKGMLDAGFPPGLVIIDDMWSEDYGVWRFDRARFPDPGAMVDQLHAWGCPVMLWAVPFVSPDSAVFRILEGRGFLITGSDGEPIMRRWWNGFSAVLDTTHPDAVAWFHGELEALQAAHGIDGFKFDAGDLRYHHSDDVTFAHASATELCESWARIGRAYPVNEYRACWRMGGPPLAQRLHDKPPAWGRDGLGSLIPESIAQGLLGLPFNCPDMVGGGELSAMTDGALDQELFVRYAQVAALFPMMQFSMAPWRVLDAEHLSALLETVRVRQRLVPVILDLARQSAITGEPILRPLAWSCSGCDDVTDQFLLGDDILVAPVLERGASARRVVLPPGSWVLGDEPTASTVSGIVDIPVGLSSLPWFRRIR